MKNKISISLAIFLVSMSAFAGGGWPQKKGKGYFKFGQYVLRASNSYYNPEANKIQIIPAVSVYTTSLYGEFGLTDRLTAIAYVPFHTRSILNALQKRNGEFVEGDLLASFGDTDLSLKYALIQDKPIVLSAKLTFGIPFGKAIGGSSGALQTGDGEFNQMLTLEASHSFYPTPLYVSGAAGFNNRTNGFSEEIRFGFETGYTFADKLTLVAKLAGVNSFQNGNPDPNAVQGVFGNNVEYLTISPEIIYSIKDNFGISFSMINPISGRQILAAPSYEGGIFLKI